MMQGKWLKCGILVLAGAMFMASACGRKALLYVDGMAVEKEELAFLNEDTERAVRVKQIQKWAEEEGLAEPFSYGKMMKQLEEENRQRAAAKTSGGTVYGMSEYTPLQYYHQTMGDYERLLKDDLMKQTDEKTLRAYYEGNREAYRQIGRTKAALTIREEGEAAEVTEIVVDRYNIRSISERDEELVSHLLSLNAGDTVVWTDGYGRACTLVCTNKDEDTYAAYEEVSGAVLEQYAAWQFEEELNRRAAESTVMDGRSTAERGNDEG